MPATEELREALRRTIRTPQLDERARREPRLAHSLTADWAERSERAWADAPGPDDGAVAADRLETQRALYELNRLRLYWFDDPACYVNEGSRVLHELHELLERPWQRWLEGAASPVPARPYTEGPSDAAALLRSWMQRDRTRVETRDSRWFAEEMNLAGYRRLLEITSLNGLVEASQLSRTLGGVAHPVQATLFRILMEEYGAGRPHKKHSAYFARMLEQQGLRSDPEAYLSRVPWEVLSAINHSFYLTENKRLFQRFCGAFSYTEVSTPVSFHGFMAAAMRLGLTDGQGDYWSLHIREDERHGSWMIEQVALPLLTLFPQQQHEVLFGYAQQRAVELMAGAAITRACRAAANEGADA